MTSTPYMKVTRHICAAQLKLRHFARKPTDTIDSAEVKAEGEILEFSLSSKKSSPASFFPHLSKLSGCIVCYPIRQPL